MTNKKKPEDDIIATAGTEPQDVSDEALEDVDGGYFQIKMTNVTAQTFTGGTFETIYSGSSNDTISGLNPTEVFGGSPVDKAGVLRKRPTR